MSVQPSTGIPGSSRRIQYLRIAVLVAVLGLTAYLITIRDQVSELSRYGYPGVFLLNALASGTILMPAPGVMMTFAFGGVFEPFWVGVVAGAGAACGELTGYAAGYSGQGVAEHFSLYKRLMGRMKLHGRATMLVLLVAAAVPNPFFDLVGIAAGVLRIRIDQFLAATLVGNIIKMVMFAYAGSFSVGWVSFFSERLLQSVR